MSDKATTMTIRTVKLEMSERDFSTLFAAVTYASEQIETDMEKVFDPDHDLEREQLASFVEKLAEARRVLIDKGAKV